VKRIGLVVHPRRDLDRPLKSLHAWAAAHDVHVVQVPMPGVERVVADADDGTTCDVIVALGGDGTTLAALHAGARARKPVLGIACGSLGALTATFADRAEEALEKFAAGDWQRQRLPAIAVSAEGAQTFVAINDVVVVRKGASQIAVAIDVNGDRFVAFAGDGIVIATPLGSSAYTLAAGGPVIAPGTDAMVLTALAPHGGTAPPLVVARGSDVTLKIEPGYYGARIEVDGHVEQLDSLKLHLAWRRDYATLVTFDGAEPFFAGLRRRGILADSPRVKARADRVAGSSKKLTSS
jgi:NAD+ kinase